MNADRKALADALELMVAALALLDKSGKAGEVGAHLDLAVCRLKEQISASAGRTLEQSGTRGNDGR